MKAVQLSITHRESTLHPIHALVCESETLQRELMLYFDVSDGHETVINYIEGDVTTYEDALETDLEIEEYEVYPDGNGGCYSYIRSELDALNTDLVAAFEHDTVAVIPPIEYLPDRRMLVSLVLTPSDLQQIRAELPEELTLDIVRVGSVPQLSQSTLTPAQRRAITIAWELGYYEIPRETTVEEIADRLDCAVSTVSDLLRRGTATLVAAELGFSRSHG